jgi:hypothetical protein
MLDNEEQKLLTTIFEHAQSAEPSQFQFICNWEDYKFYKGKRKSYRLLLKVLNKGATRLLQGYCNSVTTGNANFVKLLAYHQMSSVIAFYEQELSTYIDMINEYEAYLLEGHLLWAFLGESRAEEDLQDFRE